MALDDYDSRQLARLKKFEESIKSAIDFFELAIKWIWVLSIIGVPLIVYFSPLPENKVLQTIVSFVICCFFLFISKVDKFITKINENR